MKAFNAKGFGPESEKVTAVAGAVPEKITTVRIIEQSQLSLSIGWDDLTSMQAGGLPILNYLVVSDEADFIYSEPALNAQSL